MGQYVLMKKYHLRYRQIGHGYEDVYKRQSQPYLEKSKCQVAMRTTEFEAKKEQAVKLSVLWAKTGLRELPPRGAESHQDSASGVISLYPFP